MSFQQEEQNELERLRAEVERLKEDRLQRTEKRIAEIDSRLTNHERTVADGIAGIEAQLAAIIGERSASSKLIPIFTTIVASIIGAATVILVNAIWH